jgi:hypothetical protein
MIWMLVMLKIPVIAALWIVWWAVRAEPVPDEGRADGGGGSKRHPHPRTRPPHPPRRGPHADPPPRPPQRVRARGIQPERSRRKL